ncbi:MCE family protein [Amycolatopsis sp. NBC_00438]|uniref:MCE family protein n=1 Tax=Amycolatopsis sp. NBC_00438 TaxID=2903558 RepID=UPI002E2409B0
MSDTRFGQSLTRAFTIAIVLALVVAGGIWWTLKDAGRNHLTAYFAGTVGLYEGNSVRMLGVDMGTVTKIQPMGNQVKVEFEYDRSVAVPADAKALIVAPSLVSDRYVQLAPAYTGGPRISDGAVIGLDRTEVPLEVDQLAASLAKVSETLGPNGVNKQGSLSNLLNTAAANVDGNGQALHDTITKLGQAAGTLAGNKDDLFSTVENLGKFSQSLADSDGQVRNFEGQLADVSGYLASEKDNLAATVQQLGTTLTSVQAFIDQNHDRLKSNVDKLAGITNVLVDQRSSLAEILDVAPVGLSNLVNTYNGAAGTLDARPNLNELTQPPLVMICRLLKQVGTNSIPDVLGNACENIAGVVDKVIPLPSLAQTLQALQSGQLPPLPLPIAGQLYGGGQ